MEFAGLCEAADRNVTEAVRHFARRAHGHGELVTRAATRAGFEHGASVVVLQAAKPGVTLYRRIGFASFTSYRRYLLFRQGQGSVGVAPSRANSLFPGARRKSARRRCRPPQACGTIAVDQMPVEKSGRYRLTDQHADEDQREANRLPRGQGVSGGE